MSANILLKPFPAYLISNLIPVLKMQKRTESSMCACMPMQIRIFLFLKWKRCFRRASRNRYFKLIQVLLSIRRSFYHEQIIPAHKLSHKKFSLNILGPINGKRKLIKNMKLLTSAHGTLSHFTKYEFGSPLEQSASYYAI